MKISHSPTEISGDLFGESIVWYKIQRMQFFDKSKKKKKIVEDFSFIIAYPK